MGRPGIAFPSGPNPSEIVDGVTLADSLGYEAACVGERHGVDRRFIIWA